MGYNQQVNLQTDLLIIGGGPAGISAAIWADDLGIDRLLIERGNSLGGQLRHTFNSITNYPGFTSIGAAKLCERFELQIINKPGIRFGSEMVRVDPKGNIAHLDDGDLLGFRTMIFASGVRRRVLGVPGETEFEGRGILTSGARDPEKVKDERVVVVGGGDAAVENALILSDHAEKVYLVHRRDIFVARPDLLEKARLVGNIETLTGTVVSEFSGTDHLNAVILRSTKDADKIIELEARHAIIRIGVIPNSELLAHFVETDERGYIKVTHDHRTSIPNIFAVGDVAIPSSPTIASAIGSAATAVKTATFVSKHLKMG